MKFIPQIQPWIGLKEAAYVFRSVFSTYVTEYVYTRKFESEISKLTGSSNVVSYNNGTSALYSLIRSLKLSVQDEIIVPDITFISSATAILWAGSNVRLCPVDSRTLQIDLSQLEDCINENTKAILAVPLYGYAPNYSQLITICSKHNLVLLEDAAQGVGVTYNKKHVGTFGRAGILSFYGNKTITTAQGGVILTDDSLLHSHLLIFKNHGRENKGTFIHDYEGYNFAFTDMQAALGLAQLERLNAIRDKKQRLYELYISLLNQYNVPYDTVHILPGVEPLYWFSTFRFKDASDLSNYLLEKGIQTRRLFFPLHKQPCFEGDARVMYTTAVSSSFDAYNSYLSLPSSALLRLHEVKYVCKCIRDYYTAS